MGLIRFIKRYLEKRKLKKIENPDKIKKFSFDGKTFFARVASVYDGDTITILFYYRNELMKYSCRLYGIDTPELRGGNKRSKHKARKSRDFLKQLILNKIIKVECLKFDKYGRILIKIWYKGKNINELMITSSHAKKYFGGKK